MPKILKPDLVRHLKDFTRPGKTALLFDGPKGGPLRRSNFQEHWRKATEAGVPDPHFHDLRHTGNTWAAETGATLRDLMDRMGHSTTRAALIYLHKTAGRDRKIADALSKLVEDARNGDKDKAATASDGDAQGQSTEGHAEPGGTQGARRLSEDQKEREPRPWRYRLTWAFATGAGEGNRTLTVSLGIVQDPPALRRFAWSTRPPVTWSDLGSPRLMAR